tara:strand:- start:12632 stop:14476 length:1845 start_codon:yes stop_codon:yes gene_type:complete
MHFSCIHSFIRAAAVARARTLSRMKRARGRVNRGEKKRSEKRRRRDAGTEGGDGARGGDGTRGVRAAADGGGEGRRGDDAGDGDGVSTSYLASLDEGIKRVVKANRKRAREAQTLLKRALKVKDVKFFNRMLKDFGNEKQFGFAKETFERISRAGLAPNVYSYTNYLNAATRVGETTVMREIWKSMCDSGVEPNEVAYTVLVKGESQDGNIDRARSVVREMISVGVEPNQRTYATLLRNCVRYGDVDGATKCLETMRERDYAPDATACEYFIKTLCGELMVQRALAFVRDATRDGVEITAQSHVAIATAASLIMPDNDVAVNACRDARAILEMDLANAEKHATGSRYADDEYDARNDGTSTDAPSKSVQLFLRLRSQETNREIDAVEAYINDVPLSRRLEIADIASKGVESSPQVKIIADDEDIEPLIVDDVDDVRVEVCSGHGDWITRRAKQNPNVRWIGIEMRRNRVALTWMKSLRLGVEGNVHLVCGMAHDALSARVTPPASVSELYVNYPDPPEWVGSSQVLVDAAFLRDVHRVLKPGGHLICVTDDPAYAVRMCRELRKARALFAPAAADGKPFESGVPEDYGASYFDSMWTLGNQRDRYCMRYVKREE